MYSHLSRQGTYGWYFKDLRLLFITIILHFAVYGCSSNKGDDLSAEARNLKNLTVYPLDTEVSRHVSFKKTQIFGDTGKVLIGELKTFVVDNRGRVYVADGKKLNIKVFEPNGEFLKILGHEGRGPGEFGEISKVQIVKNKLIAYDHSNLRASIFSLDRLDYSYTVNFAGNRNDIDELANVYAGRHFVKNDLSFIMEFTNSNLSSKTNDWSKIIHHGVFYCLDSDGKIIGDSLFTIKSSVSVLVPFPNRRVGVPMGFYGQSLVELSNNDNIFTAWSRTFLIKVYDPEGRYLYAFYYPIKKKRFRLKNVLEQTDSKLLKKGLHAMNTPAHWPALHSMFFDDHDRLWISTIIDSDTLYEWWILKKSGQVITKFKWPKDKPIKTVRNGFMYTQEINSKGIDQIVKYKIQFKKNK